MEQIAIGETRRCVMATVAIHLWRIAVTVWLIWLTAGGLCGTGGH